MNDKLDDDFPSRKKVTTKGRHSQKFRNIMKQIDPLNLEEEAENLLLFDDLDFRAKISSQKRQ